MGYAHRWVKMPRPVVFALAAILATAAIIRFWDIGGPSLWTDELYSLSFARLPQNLLWSDWMVREANPPLYYSLLHVWSTVFGESEAALRSLSLCLSLGAIVVVFAITRTLHSNSAGVIAAALMAASAQQLQYSQEARAYMLGLLAAGVAILGLARLADRWLAGRSGLGETWADLSLYAGGATIAFNVHTTFFVLPVLANIYMVWLWLSRTPRRFGDARAWIAANVLVTLGCAWWLWITFQQVTSDIGTISHLKEPTLRDSVGVVGRVMATRSFQAFNLVFDLLFGALIAFGALRLKLERLALIAVLGAGIPLILLLLSFLARPIFMERTMLWAQLVYYPCLAIGVASLPSPRLRISVAAGLLAILAIDAAVWRANQYREPWREIAAILGERAGPKDFILIYDADAALNLRHYERAGDHFEAPVVAMRPSPGKTILGEFFNGAIVDQSNARRILGGAEKIWVIKRANGGFDSDPAPLTASVARIEQDNVLPQARPEVQRVRNYMTLSVWRPTIALNRT